jgi:6,7-dimethyl-8-ribityllumazine synthase
VTGLMDVQLKTEVPVFSVSLTPHHFQPSGEHEAFYTRHFVKKGREAADAVAQVLSLAV